MSYLPIENHGVIGDLSTVALVGTDGSINFMCLPEFDSASVFAALLDHRWRPLPVVAGARRRAREAALSARHGRVADPFSRHRRLAEVIDFMPIETLGVGHPVVRRCASTTAPPWPSSRCGRRSRRGSSSSKAFPAGHTIDGDRLRCQRV